MKMLNTTTYYFAYGMNTPLGRFPRAQLVGPAVLPSHVLEFHTHADVRPHKGAVVRGTLWTIDEHDLAGLDMQEGYPSYYERKIVDVYRGWRQGGRPVKAITYYMNRRGRKNLNYAAPHSSYYQTIEQGYVDMGHDVKHLEKALAANFYKESIGYEPEVDEPKRQSIWTKPARILRKRYPDLWWPDHEDDYYGRHDEDIYG